MQKERARAWELRGVRRPRREPGAGEKERGGPRAVPTTAAAAAAAALLASRAAAALRAGGPESPQPLCDWKGGRGRGSCDAGCPGLCNLPGKVEGRVGRGSPRTRPSGPGGERPVPPRIMVQQAESFWKRRPAPGRRWTRRRANSRLAARWP